MLCRFQAVLTAMDRESKFQVIETNDFNKLARITLSFHPSSDEDVKQVGEKFCFCELKLRMARGRSFCLLLDAFVLCWVADFLLVG